MEVQTKWFSDETPQNAAAASADIGSGTNGTVTTLCDSVGEEGNSYTITVSDANDGDDDADMSASISGTDITVVLGTDAVTAASTTLGSGDNGVVTTEVDTAGAAGNDYTIAVVEGSSGGSLSAGLVSTDITVTLGMTSSSKASVDLGSGDNGVVAIEVDTAGANGNNYTAEVVVGSGSLDTNLNGNALVITLEAAGNTATEIAGIVNAELGTVFTATASGTGETSITEAISETNFTGGEDAVSDDTLNTATLIAAEIDGLSGVTATASGTGVTPLSSTVAQKNFTGGADSGDISIIKNTATLIAAAIDELTGVSATASGTGTDSITAAEEEQSFTGGQYATVCPIGDVWLYIGGIYYYCSAPTGLYGTASWKSVAFTTIS